MSISVEALRQALGRAPRTSPWDNQQNHITALLNEAALIKSAKAEKSKRTKLINALLGKGAKGYRRKSRFNYYSRNGYRPRYRRRYIRGRGDYAWYDPRGWIPEGTFKSMGEAAGGGLGMKLFGMKGGGLGAKAGGALGSLASKVLGFGDYAVAPGGPGNEIVGSGTLPAVVNSAHSNIIRHKEYIGDVITGISVNGSSTAGPSAFNLQKFPINPGLQNTFPWLSGIAQQYQEYRPRGCIFEFKSTAADFGTTTNINLGEVSMATDYNVLNPDFTSNQEMLNTEFAGSCKPSQCMMHQIECDGRYNPLDKYYVRTTNVAASDLRFNDVGNFYISTNAIPTQGPGIDIGQLWVTYEWEFFKPIQPSVEGSDLISQKIQVSETPSGGTATAFSPTGFTVNDFANQGGKIVAAQTAGYFNDLIASGNPALLPSLSVVGNNNFLTLPQIPIGKRIRVILQWILTGGNTAADNKMGGFGFSAGDCTITNGGIIGFVQTMDTAAAQQLGSASTLRTGATYQSSMWFHTYNATAPATAVLKLLAITPGSGLTMSGVSFYITEENPDLGIL